MRFTRAELPDVLLLEPRVFEDPRGWFMESYNQRAIAAVIGYDGELVQDNHSHSRKGVLRGLHYQVRQPQGKLVRALSGRIFDVAVDLRRSSPSFGKWVGLEIDADSMRMLWIPPGFAHGFLVLSESADVFYKATDYYAPQHERTLRWDDPRVGIAWPLAGEPLVSEKDRRGASLADADAYP
jgi:dTDP-4-dehydrorhamnose 3,5-epimerase